MYMRVSGYPSRRMRAGMPILVGFVCMCICVYARRKVYPSRSVRGGSIVRLKIFFEGDKTPDPGPNYSKAI